MITFAVFTTAAAVSALAAFFLFRRNPLPLLLAGLLGAALTGGSFAQMTLAPRAEAALITVEPSQEDEAMSGDGHDHSHGAPLTSLPVVRSVPVDPTQDPTIGLGAGPMRKEFTDLPEELYNRLVQGDDPTEILRDFAGEDLPQPPAS